MPYPSLLHLHASCVVLSISLFVLRCGLQLAGIDWRRWRALRFAPHLIDTVLLGSAIALCMTTHQYPLTDAWLSAKLAAVLAYILLGKEALRPGNTLERTMAFMIVALLCVGYIAGVALTRSALLG